MKQDRFKCKYLECNMDGCYCKLGLNFEGYGHCLIPYKQDSCDYYQEKENEDKKLIREMASDMDYACTKHDLWPEDAKEIARVLRTLGYRKCSDDHIREIRKETAIDWHKIIIDRLKELWEGQVLTTNNYNTLVDYFNKMLKLYDDNKEEI